MNVFADSSSLSASEAARVLGVSLGTIHCWSDLGYLRAERTQAGQLRYTREDVDALALAVDHRRVGALGARTAL